jgi:hypothetical protein
LTNIIFGKSIYKIQQELVQYLPKKGNLLILGGGNGKILPLIYLHAPLLSIDYVEASTIMIKIAKKAKPKNQKITFHHLDVIDYKQKHKLIYAGFFLDLFNEKQIEELILKLENKRSKTKWYVADFHINKNISYHLIRRFQLKITILFFRITTRHTINYLPKIHLIFEKMGCKSQKNKNNTPFIFCDVFE